MILPDKTIQLRYSLLGAGVIILRELDTPQTVSSLWEKVRVHEEIATFSKFLLVLDFLYIFGLVTLKDGLLTKVESNDKKD